MKRSFLVPTAAVVLASAILWSCSTDPTEQKPAAQGVRVSFRGDYAPAAETGKNSRVAVDPATGKTEWTADDRCGVWVVENSQTNAEFVNTAEQLDIFTGTLDADIASDQPVWAYYPYSTDAVHQADSRRMTLTLPLNQVQKSTQTGAGSILTAAGKFSRNADGTPRITAMHFIHQTAGICFNIYGSMRIVSTNPEVLESVTITADVLYDRIDIDDPAAVAVPTQPSDATSMTVTVENPAENPPKIGYARADGSKAFLSVLTGHPITISSITVTTDQAIYTKHFDTPKVIDPEAGSIYPINLNINTCKVEKRCLLIMPGEHNGWDTTQGITGRTKGYFCDMVSLNGKYYYYNQYAKNDSFWYGYAEFFGTEFRYRLDPTQSEGYGRLLCRSRHTGNVRIYDPNRIVNRSEI